MNTIFSVTEEDIGKRIDVFLNEKLIDFSRSHLQKLIKSDNVKINGKVEKSNYKVRQNDCIEVTVPEAKEPDIPAENLELSIVYEDKDVIIVNKPKGMVVHPAPGHYSGTLVNGLMYHFGNDLSGINGILRPGIVHRIDRDTTGLLVVCKNDNSHNCLAAQLKEHSIARKYHAIVHGILKDDEGVIDAPIGRHPNDRKKMCINEKNGRNAVTHYRVLQRFSKYTYIECQLETGRTHQIRVHMASQHHPILGDEVYGPAKSPFKLQGQTLHAKTLGFIHPTTKAWVEFDSPLPEYFLGLLTKLT